MSDMFQTVWFIKGTCLVFC